MDILQDLKNKNSKTMENLKKEFLRIRAGKANPAILENIRVSYYGQMTPLNQMSSISISDARTLVIAPWDTTALGDIERAIHQGDLGLNPQNDGKVIRIHVPPLTEERRKELVKLVNKTAEECRVAIRQNRKTINEEIKNQEKQKKISEDDSRRQQEKVQQATDEAIKMVDDVLNVKTKEIMTI